LVELPILFIKQPDLHQAAAYPCPVAQFWLNRHGLLVALPRPAVLSPQVVPGVLLRVQAARLLPNSNPVPRRPKQQFPLLSFTDCSEAYSSILGVQASSPISAALQLHYSNSFIHFLEICNPAD
jgi:hypothetical protein